MRTSFYIYTILLILFYFINCKQYANKRRYCRNHKKESDKNGSNTIITLDKDKEGESCTFYNPGELDNHLPMQKCSIDFDDSRKIINPFKNFKESGYNMNHFKSACLKCAACLAIAEHINQTITAFYYEHNTELQTIKNCQCGVLNNLCVEGFKNYDLREYNGQTLITKASIHSKHVNSNIDGSWTKVLRDLCNRYVQNMDVHDILYRYKSGHIDFTNYICNGDGIFRDCKNIDLKQIEMPQAETAVSVNVCVNCV